jgi:hypothetical protein
MSESVIRQESAKPLPPFELTQISDHKAANHIRMLRCSARVNRVNLFSKNKFHLAQCFAGRFASEFPKVMHHVHLIEVPKFMCDIGPRCK